MLDQLINMGKDQLGQNLMQKENLNNQQMNDAFDVAKDSMFSGISNQAMSGNLSQLTSLFNGNQNNSSFLNQSVMNSIIPQLSSKLGVSNDKASSIASLIVPFLISKFASNETGTVNNSNDFMSMFGIGGGNNSGNMLDNITDNLGGFFK